MLLALKDAWTCGPITGNSRVISGVNVSFKNLPLRERYDLALEVLVLLKEDALKTNMLSNPRVMPVVERMIALSDAPESLFDTDLTTQIPVALTGLEINLAGFFDYPERMSLSQSRHKAVRKAMRAPDNGGDDKRIAPLIMKYWFLWRPVIAEICTYEAMFIDERFTFTQIHELHEMLDLKQFNEIIASHVEK